MEFNSVILNPDPTPTENTVTPWPLSLEASRFVAAVSADWPVMNDKMKRIDCDILDA